MDSRGGQRRNPYELTEESPVYVISVAAQLSGLHPQTLRQYDRLGLVSPDRTPGRGRRYSARDIELLRTVQQLSQDEGINLAGIKRIIELENQVAALQQRVVELQGALEGAASAMQQREAAVHASYRRDLVPYHDVQQTSALVVWRPKRPGDPAGRGVSSRREVARAGETRPLSRFGVRGAGCGARRRAVPSASVGVRPTAAPAQQPLYPAVGIDSRRCTCDFIARV